MCAKVKSPDDFLNIVELVKFFKDEATCLKYIEEWLWDGKIRCPHCGFEDPYRYSNGIHFKCKNCTQKFTAKVGTIFEGTKLPLQKWFMAIYLISSNKRGISSCQLARDLQITQKSSWFMLHRIRKSMEQIDEDQLKGIVEIDETFVGGKNKNRHKGKKVIYGGTGRSFQDKTPIFGIKNRLTGQVKTVVIPDVTGNSIQPLIKKHIEKGSTIYSDDWNAYGSMRLYIHGSVDHGKGQYRNGDICTNGIENFWSHLKRMILGVYYKVSPKHLQRYADELTFRFNTRLMNTGERIKMLFRQFNCNLKYKKLILGYGY